MEVISAREFRTNQSKYFGMVHDGEDVVLKSREWGSFRLVPITANDAVANKEDLTSRICKALHEVKMIREGKLKAADVSVADDDDLSKAELQSIQKGLEDIKNGRTYKMQEGESLTDFLKRTEACMK